MCSHTPPCPAPSAPDREAAHTIVSHPEQGWSLLCNGVVIFEDTGELLPGGAFIAPHRPTDLAAFDRPVGVAPGHGRQASAALSVMGDISRSLRAGLRALSTEATWSMGGNPHHELLKRCPILVAFWLQELPGPQ